MSAFKLITVLGLGAIGVIGARRMKAHINEAPPILGDSPAVHCINLIAYIRQSEYHSKGLGYRVDMTFRDASAQREQLHDIYANTLAPAEQDIVATLIRDDRNGLLRHLPAKELALYTN